MKKILIILLTVTLFLQNSMIIYATDMNDAESLMTEVYGKDKNIENEESERELVKESVKSEGKVTAEEEIDSSEEADVESLESGKKIAEETTIPAIEDVFEEELTEVVNDNENQASIEDDDPQYGRENGYSDQEFYDLQLFSSEDTGYIHNSKFNNYQIKNVIDVSYYQGDIDWVKVKQSGIDYAFIRAGYRGYGAEGIKKTDSMFTVNMEQAIEAGLEVGVYFFSQAISEAEAKEEAEYVLDLISNYNVTLPVVIDFEFASSSAGYTGRLYNANLSKEDATKICEQFCTTVESNKYSAMIYANKDMLQNHLNASELSQNHKIWLANYTNCTSYEGDYDFWQYTPSGKVDGISGNVDKSFWYVEKEKGLIYRTHIQDIGWQEWKTDGELSGTTGKLKRIEAICIQYEGDIDGSIEHRAQVQGIGWQEWKADGAMSGTSGQSKRLEGIRIRLTGKLAEKYDVYYRVHIQDYGWLNWAKNGESAGSNGLGKRLEGIQIALVEKDKSLEDDYNGIVSQVDVAYVSEPFGVTYQSHVQGMGWQGWKEDGDVSGTSGQLRRVEALAVKLKNIPYAGGVSYQAYIEEIGWQDWKSDGAIAGTSGQSKRLEAVKIKLTGEITEYYDIYYRVHIQNYGWLNWAKNGESAGSEGLSYRVEAIQIIVEEKGKEIDQNYQNIISQNNESFICPPIRVVYQSHIQDIGWQNQKYNGEMSGTSGQSKKIEALKINLEYSSYEGGIIYQSHVQDIGWQAWKSDNELSGTMGQSKRIEAIKINLTGKVADYYDVCYRVHVQDYGWLNWVINGDIAGTTGESKRVEAIEVILVQKGMGVPATSTSGTIKKYSISDGSKNFINAKIEAEVQTKVASDDDFYYVVVVDSYGDGYNTVQSLAKIQKTEAMSLDVAFDSNARVEAALMDKVALAIMQDGKYKLISTPVSISNPEAIAENKEKIFEASSKKGLQGITFASKNDGYNITDARNANTKQTLLNLDLASVVGSSPTSGYVAYQYKGKTYYFSDCADLRNNIRSLNNGYTQYLYGNNGTTKVSVSLCILLSYNSSNSYLIDPAARTKGHSYYMLNVREEKARETLEAVFLYLGEIFGQKDCYVTNWILGNEINSSRAWNYSGSLDFDTYMQCYATAFRLLYNGVKSEKSGNTMCISLDNGWTAVPDTYAGKTTLDSFAKKIDAENSNIEWSIAYHAYSYPLTRADFWNDTQNTSNSTATRYISMQNITVLTNYAASLEKAYGKTSGSIRVLLTEQGYSYSAGADNQAMAIARGYYIAEFNNRIDAFIIRSILDDADETKGNLYFGLMNRRQDKRTAFYVYEYMDSDLSKFSKTSAQGTVLPENYSKFNSAQNILCNTNWKSIIPGFDATKLAGIK